MILNNNNLIVGDALISEKYLGGDLFCTKSVSNPKVIFDLHNVYNVSSIKIKNRSSHKNYTDGIQIFFANSDFIFNKLDVQIDDCFNLKFIQINKDLRYLMFSLPRVGQLSLNSIELETGRPNHTNFNTIWGFIDPKNTYYPLHDSGFFSMLTTILEDLINIRYYFDFTKSPVLIANDFIFSIYRDGVDLKEGDFYDYFEKPLLTSEFDINSLLVSDDNQFIVTSFAKYENLNFALLNSFVDIYFQPSSKVFKLCDEILAFCGLDLNKTIGIHYRGTDKSTEIELKSLNDFLVKCDELLLLDPDCKIFCLSDQTQILNELKIKYGDSFVTFENLPTTSGDRGLHYTLTQNRKDFAFDFLCCIIILSRCKFVITHTGNGALWTALFRRSTTNFYQI